MHVLQAGSPFQSSAPLDIVYIVLRESKTVTWYMACLACRVEDVIAAQEPMPLSKDITTSWDSSLDNMEKKANANLLDHEEHAKAIAKVGNGSELPAHDFSLRLHTQSVFPCRIAFRCMQGRDNLISAQGRARCIWHDPMRCIVCKLADLFEPVLR